MHRLSYYVNLLLHSDNFALKQAQQCLPPFQPAFESGSKCLVQCSADNILFKIERDAGMFSFSYKNSVTSNKHAHL